MISQPEAQCKLACVPYAAIEMLDDFILLSHLDIVCPYLALPDSMVDIWSNPTLWPVLHLNPRLEVLST